MLKKLFIPLIVLLLGAVAAVYIYTAAPRSDTYDIKQAVPVESFTLRNGLRVVVMPNHRIPAVEHALFVRVGAADDPYGKTGLAHYVEHLMFTGTKKHPEGEYDRIIASLGGEHNAYTTRDYTTYYVTIAKEHLATVMAMEADRLEHLALDSKRAAREIPVIQEERKWRVDNQLTALLAEEVDAVQLLNHPYRQPTIGWPEDIARYAVKDARDFMTSHYRPSNMVLVVAGDVEVAEVRKLAQQHYGPLRAGVQPKRHWPEELLPSRSERRVILRDARVEQPQLVRSYIAPSIKFAATKDVMPLHVWAQYLGGGTTSILYNELVRNQKIATSVSVDYSDWFEGPSSLTITAEPAQGVTLERLESALDSEVMRALSDVPDVTDMGRAKNLLKAETIYAQDGLSPLAHVMGQLYILGLDERVFYHWSDTLDAVTPEQMMQAARAVMVPSRQVTGILVPKEAEGSHAP
ncbi:MAG: M16 family metallopeptidase [Rickettsiales bacterium]